MDNGGGIHPLGRVREEIGKAGGELELQQDSKRIQIFLAMRWFGSHHKGEVVSDDPYENDGQMRNRALSEWVEAGGAQKFSDYVEEYKNNPETERKTVNVSERESLDSILNEIGYPPRANEEPPTRH